MKSYFIHVDYDSAVRPRGRSLYFRSPPDKSSRLSLSFDGRRSDTCDSIVVVVPYQEQISSTLTVRGSHVF
jgi:hypothetical protein